MKMYLLFLSLFFCITFAQSSISGTVTDSDVQPIFGANIKVVGGTAGTVTDSEGKFFKLSSKLPYVIEISSIGFISKQVNID
jgi:hypothetical protein